MRRFPIRPLRGWLAVGLLAFTAAVSAQDQARILVLEKDESQMKIGELKPAYIDFSYRSNPRIAIPEIVSRYTRLLKSTRDPEVRLKVLERLAALQNLFGEVVEQAVERESLGAIMVETYEDYLKANPKEKDNDWILYQLARAYEASARPEDTQRALERLLKEFPRSPLVAEAWFRVGELRYNRGDYKGAEAAYRSTLKEPGGKAFEANARYMLGWTIFKQNRLDAAADTFVGVLGELQKTAEAEARSELREDVLRILSVIAEYQGGFETLHAVLERNRASELAPLLYRRHVDFFLEKERYQDAAGVADDFITRYPGQSRRVEFHNLRIQAFEAGQLPTLAWQERERFVKELGPGSSYWNTQSPEARAVVGESLYRYLDELGRRDYALASGSRDSGAERGRWKTASQYFETFLTLFPGDPKAAETTLLLGESRLASGDRPGAVAAFERAGYDYPDFTGRREAAYAGLMAYPEPAAGDAPDPARIEAFERFARTFPEDARSGTVLFSAASERYRLEQHSAVAANLGELLGLTVASSPYTLDAATRQSAFELLGHAEFAQQRWASAESAYREALVLAGRRPEQRDALPTLRENLAASIYRQGEMAQGAGQLADARSQYLRIVDELPETRVAQSARHDAAMRAIDLQDWGQAADLLQDYRQRYPADAQAKEVGQKLVFVYQQGGQSAAAAGELLALVPSLDPEAARKARYQAAELYQESGDTARAAVAFKDYVERYPSPFETAVSAHDHLIQLAVREQSEREARQWRERLVAFEATGGSERSDGTRSLAAAASLALAESLRQAYAAERLTLPLQKSLGRKSQALRELVSELNRVSAYGVRDYVTAATFMMGQAYQELSQDILNSERPARLSELELEQYNLLLEEQAYPFEEKAIEILESNVRRTQDGLYDDWVQKSFRQLGELIPTRYAKLETLSEPVGRLR